ncbi:MAG: transglycosylase SLT domain-containing protein [Candidatus Electrothrix aestuarii]|uniref:Transglycosylase SLT domain-containing protein n=1 Tax=Candidatus Electrothrix aestuarii TaxID=3062594 RepID=A0AAU8M128_9BACT|nr:transglycosylase SLT domain-containing protein [Candidatus Electrothrix aestuarii]
MKVSLVVPLVSLPFFVACSPAVHNTDPLKNINQEELARHSFLPEQGEGERDVVHGKEKQHPVASGSEKKLSQTTGVKQQGGGTSVVKYHDQHAYPADNLGRTPIKYGSTGIPQARVIYNSELVPIVEEKDQGQGEGRKEATASSVRPLLQKEGLEKISRPSLSSIGRSVRHVDYVGNEEPEEAAPLYIPVQSEQELKEELTALEKTGDWSDDGAGKQTALATYGIQCDLPKSFASPRVNLNLDFLTSIAKGKQVVPEKKAEQPEEAEEAEETGKLACDFPVTINKQVEFYLDQFQNRQRRTFRTWLKRAANYLPAVEKELEEAGLPKSLAYLAMIESGFNPVAYSPARAAGLWQFMSSTARTYGLRVDSWVDERRDPEKSTQAAVSYLNALYKRFGDWQLAVAAYNAGEGKIQRGLDNYGAKTFWELAAKKYLPLETKRYVPKLIAAIIIAHDPKRYGFQPVQGKEEQYDVVDVPSRTSLSAIAAAGGCSVKKIRQLNNELLKNKVPPTKGMYRVKVPAGSSMRIAANLEKIRAAEERKIVHKLRAGETLSGVGKQYNVSVNMIMQWNDINDVRRIRAGRKLALYLGGKSGVAAADVGEEKETVSYYKVRNGDSLWSIARKHQVSTKEIKRWNSLDNNLLHPGKKLVIKKS